MDSSLASVSGEGEWSDDDDTANIVLPSSAVGPEMMANSSSAGMPIPSWYFD